MGFWYDEDECKWRPHPVPADHSPRRHSRFVLMEALIEEIERGSGLTRLFAMLLAAELAKTKYHLTQKYGKELKRVGVALEDPNRKFVRK